MGEVLSIHSVKTSFLQEQGSWIFFPERVAVSVSEDGKNFKALRPIINKLKEDFDAASKTFDFDVNKKARYIKVHAKNIGICPAWHQGVGGDAWIFVDEIIVE